MIKFVFVNYAFFFFFIKKKKAENKMCFYIGLVKIEFKTNKKSAI